MKKTHRFDQLSNVECRQPGCKKKLKLRLVEVKPTITHCYDHEPKNRISGHSKRSR